MKLTAETCMLCPRRCGVNRGQGQKGRCHVDDRLIVARAALHMWEEPCISGEQGSGAVFFSGCNLGCVFCQNREISGGRAGEIITIERLADIFLELQEQQANNINLVTAAHYVPQVREAILLARGHGLTIPIVYNSSGYELPETLRMLEGLIDVWLPDMKYLSTELAGTYSKAPDYPHVAKAALAEMVRQSPKPEFDENGMIQKGVIVRHLILPGHVKEAKQVIRYLHDTYGNQIYISMMNQYTPMEAMKDDPLLSRKVTKREYGRVIDYALEIGVEQGFIQEGETAMESFIPAFDKTGVKRNDAVPYSLSD